MSERSEVLQRLASNPEVLAHKWGITREDLIREAARQIREGLIEDLEEILSMPITEAAARSGLSAETIRKNGQTFQSNGRNTRITHRELKNLIQKRTL